MTHWLRWVRFCQRPLDTRAYAAVRIAVAVVMLADIVHLVGLGLADDVYHTFENGGLSAFKGGNYALGALGPEAGMLALTALVISLTGVATGIAVRPAILVAVLASAQLGTLYPPGDRAIDRILRTVLLLLLFSGSHLRWSLGRRLRGLPAVETAPAWPADLIRLLLVNIYLSAGIGKLGSTDWLPSSRPPELYTILTDPTTGRLDHVAWHGVRLPFHLGALFALILELTSPLLLSARLGRWWAIGGALFHLGIAATMRLGIFPWGMLAIYPLLLHPWRRSDRVPAQPAQDDGLVPGDDLDR